MFRRLEVMQQSQVDESFTGARSFHALVTSAGGGSGGFTCSRSANPATGHVIEPTLSRPPMQSSHVDIKNTLGLMYETSWVRRRGWHEYHLQYCFQGQRRHNVYILIAQNRFILPHLFQQQVFMISRSRPVALHIVICLKVQAS